MSELYHLAEERPEHKAWGIYRRPKKSRASRPFVLVGICIGYIKAKNQAEALLAAFPTYDYATQGEAIAANLPDTYTP